MMHVDLGRFRVTILKAGRFRLDGGGMFGVVPKPLWQQHLPADERNRVELDCNCLLVRGPDLLAVVDTGYGNRLNPKEKDIYGIDNTRDIITALSEIGVQSEEITHVVLTHLHFDHASGGLRSGTHRIEPAFPKAAYFVQAGELEDAAKGLSHIRTTYRVNDIEALNRHNRLRTVCGDVEIAPGLTTFITGGHTRHHQGILLDGGDRKLAFPGDLLPTHAHLSPYWIMAFDMFPHQTLEQKETFLARACAERWLVAWDHDPEISISTIDREGGQYIIRDPDI